MPRKENVGIDHIGVTVVDAARSVQRWEKLFGVTGRVLPAPTSYLVQMGIVHVGEVTFFFNQFIDKQKQLGNLSIPVLFSDKKIVTELGEGVSHIALRVPSIEAVVQGGRKAGVRTKWDKPKETDGHGGLNTYLMPEDVGFELELVERLEGKKPLWE